MISSRWGALRTGMDVNQSWTAQQWMNRGAELLDPDPRLAQRLLSQGLQLEPKEAIGWFNLGIGLHQQRHIEAAVRAYQQCLALPHNKRNRTVSTEQPRSGFAAAGRLATRMASLRISLPTETRQSPRFY